MSKYIEMKGYKFGALIADEFIGGAYGEWRCTCTLCNDNNVIFRGKDLRNGTKIMCNKCKKDGKVVDSYKLPSFSIDNIKYNMKGMKIGSVTVNEYYRDGSWKCTCDCGEEIIVKGYNLREALENNKDYCCEKCSHKKRLDDITGKIFNNWKVLEYVGNQMYKCECQCENKTIKLVNGKSLKNGTSKSCGCMTRDLILEARLSKLSDIATNIKQKRNDEQIMACENREQLIRFIIDNFKEKPTITELADKLGIGTCMTARKIHKFNIEDIINYNTNRSNAEKELEEYIRTIYDGDIIISDRKVLDGKELDIYIPDLNIAIEFNGSYWHSSYKKDKRYHLDKSLSCSNKGIRLIHIYEYEWNNDKVKEKLKNYFSNILSTNKNIIYARNTVVKEVKIEEAKQFIDENHIQGYSSSSINMGMYYENELIGIMTLSKPRFNNNYQYEIVRLCWKHGVNVVGGAEKLFSNIVDKYNIKSVISYCSIDKFDGKVYERIGMTLSHIAEPGYVWVNSYTNDVLTRYQTTKQKLIEKGIASEKDTEDSIMCSLGYIKIYNSGNKVYTWSR